MIKYFIQQPEQCPPIVFEQKTEGASGFDLQATVGCPKELEPGSRWKVNTGLFLAMSPGIEAQVRPRSSMVLNHGVGPMQSTVDSDYRGEISMTLFNHGQRAFTIRPGERVAQLVFSLVLPQCIELLPQLLAYGLVINRVPSIAALGETKRGAKGFGSTGM